MKEEVLHGLLVARSLFDSSRILCFVCDRYVASAGLVVLQDALEIVLYSCLLEIRDDDDKSAERLDFDQLIGELRKRGKRIAKSGTLKAMNKQRVLIKHHAQLAEPIAVQQYYRASVLAADSLLVDVIGKPLQHIIIADAISSPELKTHITEATSAIEAHRYPDALIAARKALFRAIESAYDVRPWLGIDPFMNLSYSLEHKAPYYARDPKWIQENVLQPTDFVVLDNDRVRLEMLEIGIDPEEFWNVRCLPPLCTSSRTKAGGP